MTKKVKVLVFPAGTEIAFEIHAALRHSKFVELYGATSVPCHAEMLFKMCANHMPFAKDPNVIPELNNLVDSWGIDYIYPAHDDALFELTKHRDELHADVVTSDWETVATCRSKISTYCALYGDANYLPEFFISEADSDACGYPLFVKPDIGQGGIGARRVNNRKELDAVLADGNEYVICEYLPGKEYTVDCFTDRHGQLRYVGQRTRERIRSGIAVRSRFVTFPDPQVLRMAHDMNNRFNFNGAWFFQIKGDRNGDLKLLEIAPRIAGTMGLSRNRGVNMPLLTLYNMMWQDVDILVNTDDILVDRAFISRYQSNIDYDNVYVDLDDTLIQDGNVNEYLLAFLYQCKNKGKRIVLLTKHSGSALMSLEDHDIDMNLFNSVINIPQWAEKHHFIEDHSIFIDDSFSERKEVHERWGIPVFDVDMIESLFDWCA